MLDQVKPTKGDAYFLSNPAELPDPTRREWLAEPYVRLEIITPEEYVGPLMELAQVRALAHVLVWRCRGSFVHHLIVFEHLITHMLYVYVYL